MKKCNYCERHNPDEARICRGCGASDFSPLVNEVVFEIPKEEPAATVSSETKFLGIALILLFVAVLFMVSAINHAHQDGSTDAYPAKQEYVSQISQEEMVPPQPAFVTSSDVLTNTSNYGTYWGYTTWDDSYGTTHSGDIVRMVQINDYIPSIEFITAGKYTEFTTTIFTTLLKEDHRLQLKIYADNILVYDTGFVDRTFKEADVEIDITGVYALKIECYEDGYVGPFDMDPDFCLQDMLFWY